MIKAIVFDCWGTLFYDDIKPHPFHEFAGKIGHSFRDYSFLKLFERNLMLEKCDDIESAIRDILRELKIEPKRELVDELVYLLAVKSVEYIKAYPDTLVNLNKLRQNFKVALLSNDFSWSFGKLEERYNIKEIFDVIVLSHEVGLIKPNPKIYQITLDKLGVKKEEVLIVGDNLKDDVIEGENFGFRGLLLDRKNKYPKYINKIKSLEEIYDHLK
ncbi:MAG: HAD family hydrolase [Candidatus Woesearchaeota archaeon]|nr:MAG: HAD family hydrolase [Candidatus Woesearchaeota archaeon]